jgi:hypothetical protein
VNRVTEGNVGAKVVLTLFLSLSSSFCLAAYGAPKNDTVWMFDCQHFGSGKYRYLVAANAIKIINLSNGGVVLTKAPKWKVSCFRDSEKLEWQGVLDRFDLSSALSTQTRTQAKKKADFEVLGKEKLLGLSCLKYQLGDGSIFWVAEGLKSPPQVNEIVSRYFRTPAIEAIPLKILKREKAVTKATPQSKDREKLQKTIPWLSVNNLRAKPPDNCYAFLTDWKKIPYKDSDFDYPKGYKQTKNIKEIVVSQKNRQALEDLVEGLSR